MFKIGKVPAKGAPDEAVRTCDPYHGHWHISSIGIGACGKKVKWLLTQMNPTPALHEQKLVSRFLIHRRQKFLHPILIYKTGNNKIAS
jgi:hypothetical protein